jgi:phenylalanyl-tRNA synthetase beta chain
MGILTEKNKDTLTALIPAYRTDILHWIDLVEEVAIAYGYDNFKEEIPKISTIAEEDKKSIIRRKIAEVLTGLQFLETSSYHLTTKHDIKMLYPEQKDFIEVEESKTEYNILRQDILSNTLKILSENSDSSYPQNLFETGRVFLKNPKEETGIEEKEKLSVAMASETANFTEIKQVLDYLMRMLGKEYKIEEFEHLGLAPGRTGKIIVDNQSVGFLGEIHPRVLKNLKIKMPTAALEIDLNFL